MKKLITDVLDYGPWIFFLLLAGYGLVAPWILGTPYDQRTYLAVLAGVLIFLSLKQLEYVKVRREKRAAKTQPRISSPV